MSGEEEVEDERKFFFSPDPLILELLSCFRFLGFFDVLESSSERLLFISRLEEPEAAEGILSSRRGMISNPAVADDDPPKIEDRIRVRVIRARLELRELELNSNFVLTQHEKSGVS